MMSRVLIFLLLVLEAGLMLCQDIYDPLLTSDGPFILSGTNDKLPRRHPGKIGDTTTETLRDGRLQTVITRATEPPIFELPNFLSDKECDRMIELAKSNGLHTAAMFGKNGSFTEKSRQGQTTFINGKKDKLLRKIQHRAMDLTSLSQDIVYNNEDFQFGLYSVGGFYHFHYDSFPRTEEEFHRLPCCQYSPRPHNTLTCTVCRYVTILMYLNDVEKGGETAFPLAGKPGVLADGSHADLEANCLNSPVVVKPKKGSAVMWYNNVLDPETGWLGVHDTTSMHGGCPILKGHKWISNLWIDAPQYKYKNKRTIYHDEL